MVVTVGRVDMQLTSSAILGQLMDHNGYSVRGLSDAVNKVLRKKKKKIECGRGTIGNLRSGYRSNCNPEIAEAICELLNIPLSALFVTKVSNVQREVRNHRKESK